MWQSSSDNEDAPETWVAYSRSQDGKSWIAPMTLVPSWDQGYRSSGGWWINGDTLVAYVNVWPSSVTPRGGYTEYATSEDGLNWSALKRPPMADGSPLNGIFEQDPHSLPDGRIIGAAHFQPGLLVSPIYTDDPSGVRGWTKGRLTNLSYTGNTTREMEPSWFRRADGAAIMVFRDQNSTFRRLASISLDRGVTWSAPVATDMPDSRSKQSAGNLPDGTAFQVGNPVDTALRIPLVVSLSRDGQVFDKAFILRKGGSDLQARRYTGTSKTLGYSYPKSMVGQGFLYVSYATNKEDIEYTRVPLSSLSVYSPVSNRRSPVAAGSCKVRVVPGQGGIRTLSLRGWNGDRRIRLFSLKGELLSCCVPRDGEANLRMESLPSGVYMIEANTGRERKTLLFKNP
jgi:hypothetical protein